jgi:transposase
VAALPRNHRLASIGITGCFASERAVCESLVFTWRRQVREGVLMAPEMATFMPVRMFEPLEPASASMPPPPSQASALTRPASGLIEIELGNGRQVRVGSDVNLAALRRVLTALRG